MVFVETNVPQTDFRTRLMVRSMLQYDIDSLVLLVDTVCLVLYEYTSGRSSLNRPSGLQS